MGFELPFMKAIERQAHPKVVFGSLNPAHNLGITAGFPHSNNSGAKMAAKVGFRPQKMAAGGIAHMDGGGYFDGAGNYDLDSAINASSGSGTPFSPMDPNYTAPLPAASDTKLQLPKTSLYNGNTSDYNSMIGSSGDDSQTVSNPDGSLTYSAPRDSQSHGTGIAGWMNNTHAGIKGSDWLKAGITALTGILSGIASKHANQKSINTSQFQNGFAPTIQAPASPYAFAGGGLLGGSLIQDVAGDVSAIKNMVHPQGDGFFDVGTQQGATKMAAGGPAPSQPEDAQSQMIVMNAIQAILGQSRDPQGAIQNFVSHFGQEALQALVQQVHGQGQGQGQGPGSGSQQPPPGAASGGILSGPGDGMSDSIPANNGNVRVADGEYVVPADAVSQLGNGSTAAGARKLDAGIANLRQSKYGHSRQPKKLKPNQNPILG